MMNLNRFALSVAKEKLAHGEPLSIDTQRLIIELAEEQDREITRINADRAQLNALIDSIPNKGGASVKSLNAGAKPSTPRPINVAPPGVQV